jgi:hypothetical protein
MCYFEKYKRGLKQLPIISQYSVIEDENLNPTQLESLNSGLQRFF